MFPDRNSTETLEVMIGNVTLNATANYTCYNLDENSFASKLILAFPLQSLTYLFTSRSGELSMSRRYLFFEYINTLSC